MATKPKAGATTKPATKAPTKPKGMTAAELNALINQASVLRERAAEATRQLNLITTEQDAVEAKLLDEFIASGTQAQRAMNGAMFSVKRDTVPKVEDWSAVDAYILKHKRLELLQRRLGVTAWRELVDTTGKPVPGVEAVEVVKLHYTRPKS